MELPRIMLAAPASGSGKTLITCGILRLLQRKRLNVQAFKCGPDYIDPQFHKKVLGIPSRNLDTFFVSPETVQALFAGAAEGKEISVIEGVMGYFDGTGEDGMEASSYALAAALHLPVILVINARGMSRSVVPLIRGFLTYGSSWNIRGVFLNRVTRKTFLKMRSWIEGELHLAVVGYLPNMPELSWESRHLGLMQPEELTGLQGQVDMLADTLSETLDLDMLTALAREAPPFQYQPIDLFGACEQAGLAFSPSDFPEVKPANKVRIGVAMDQAFSFYYEDNLDLLRRLGAEIVPFSPLKDSVIPQVDGLIFGGGYPELYAAKLSENAAMRSAALKAAESGLPILAECGGFLYLQEELTDPQGKTYPMVGFFSGKTKMQDHLVRFGYVTLQPALSSSLYLMPGHSIRGHEFHYYDSTVNGDSCMAHKASGQITYPCMTIKKAALAGFPHLYYYSDPAFAAAFVRKCHLFSSNRK